MSSKYSQMSLLNEFKLDMQRKRNKKPQKEAFKEFTIYNN